MYSGASLNKIDDHLKQHLNSPNDTCAQLNINIQPFYKASAEGARANFIGISLEIHVILSRFSIHSNDIRTSANVFRNAARLAQTTVVYATERAFNLELSTFSPSIIIITSISYLTILTFPVTFGYQYISIPQISFVSFMSY